MYLNPVGVLGGAERVLLDVLSTVRTILPTAELHLVAGADGPLLERALQLGVQVAVLPMPDSLNNLGDSVATGGRLKQLLRLGTRTIALRKQAFQYAEKLRSKVVSLQPNLIHSNGIKTHLLSHYARLGEFPLIWHVHDYVQRRPIVSRLLRWSRQSPQVVVGVSQSVANDATRAIGVPVEVIHNALDLLEFSPLGPVADLDSLAGSLSAEKTVRVGLVATYARWKGHDIFLQAIQAIASRSTNVQFYIIGGPVYQTAGSQFSRSELKRLASELGIHERVKFVDFQEDIASIYRALDIVVHASTKPEPFGRVVAEAMACGRAVVISRTSGVQELIDEEIDVPCHTPGSVKELSEAVWSLISDAARRTALGKAVNEMAQGAFSLQRLGSKITQAYGRISSVCESDRAASVPK